MQGHARFHCRLLPLCRIVAAALVLAAASTVAQAQVPSNETWRTIATEHFRVHFTPQLETQARHAASVAERAYANLAGELARPRGLIDVVISDATDASNGSATVVPRPSIIIYARPPVNEPSLESYDDWTVLVMQHELTHIFHLDRSRGWWRAAQSVFGRNPVLFPNYYTPAWLTEGLAVYYESRFTNGGRLHGSFDAVVARSAAIDNVLPPLGDISLATSRFPYGQSVYVYGSFVWDELARSHGASSIPAFVERSSGEPIPFLLDMEARQTFGESFTHAWNRWRDSVLRAVDDSAELRLQPRVAAPGFGSSQAFELSDGGRYILAPRWVNDSTIVYAANTGRSSPGLYIARRGETPERVSRRNSLDMNDPSRPGEIVYAQGDYIDRFHTRGDLYVSTQFGDRRITRGQRLSEPSVRRDGTIIAVRTVPGTTQLVRVSSRGDTIVPLTPVAPDTQWTDPRWSPDGGRIAAVRISSGVSAVVVLDSIGRVLSTPVIERAVIRSPAWLPDGRGLIFTSDVDGTSQLYVAGVDSSDAPSRGLRLTADAAGLYGADVVGVDDDSVRVVTTALRGDGYHVLVWTVAGVQVAPPVTIQSAGVADSISHVSLSQASSSQASSSQGSSSGASSVGASAATLAVGRTDPRWRVTDDTTRARAYSPWRTLAPAYWSPTFAQAGAGRGDLIGALTGASDVTGRHSYIAQAAINLHNSNVDASLAYDYDRWINPALAFSLDQSWSYASITSAGVKVGDLERRSRFASVHATFSRPRVRTYSAMTLGAEFEQRDYESDPAPLLPRLDQFYSRSHRYPTLVAAAVFSNTQRPTLSISPEDGITVTGSVRQRWESSNGASGRSAVLVGSAFKSLDLPGFAHHVVALRGAIGAADRRSPSEYEVGGVSGSSVEIVPGINFGSAARTFPVRGFPSGAESGVNAASVSAEYRLPLIAPARSLGLFPFFLDRVSLSLFGDAARASCPAAATPACSPSPTDGPTLASIGGELNLDTALQFDVPYRFRLGLAHPVHGRTYAGASAVSAYATLGLAF